MMRLTGLAQGLHWLEETLQNGGSSGAVRLELAGDDILCTWHYPNLLGGLPKFTRTHHRPCLCPD